MFKRVIQYMDPRNIEPKMVRLWIFWLIFGGVMFCLPKSIIENSVWIIVPLAGLFIYALVTRDVIQSMLMGTLMMYLAWYKIGFIKGFFDGILVCLAEKDTIEMYMSFFLCGGIIIALKRSGSTRSFTDFITKRFGKNDKMILASAGIYSGLMSVDDYVSALTAGTSFGMLVERIHRPRLALAYIVRTFSICVSALLPFGAWGYFIIFQIADAKSISNRAQATSLFIKTIPCMFFPIIAVIIAFLFAIGLFPKLGKMKEAYRLAADGIQMGELSSDREGVEEFDENDPRKNNVSILNLLIPMATIVVALIATGLNCFLAFGIATFVTGLLYILQGIMTIGEYVQCVVDGFIDMMDMVIILLIGYVIQNVMYIMGMEKFVMSVCSMIPIVAILPVALFVFFCITEYFYSLNYALYQIAIPVLLVVLPKVGANVPLCIGAVISAGLFGASACVVSDLGVVSARACRVEIYEQYVVCQPYVIITGVLAAVMYLVVGLIGGC